MPNSRKGRTQDPRCGLVLLAFALYLVSPTRLLAQCPYAWDPIDGIQGADRWVNASTVFDDGDGPCLYVGGAFSIAGDVAANSIAKWSPASRQWSALGSGVTGQVGIITPLNNKIYVAGSLTAAGGNSVNNIAAWDVVSRTWTPLGSGLQDFDVYKPPQVRAAVALDGKLYVGSWFNTAGGITAHHIACWDPATGTWSALGEGTDAGVLALLVWDGKLYVGGMFTHAGGLPANGIACWDPATETWSAVGAASVNGTSALAVVGGQLYAGGWFNTGYGGGVANYLARFDPATQAWSPLESELDGEVTFLLERNGQLYAGGYFHNAGAVAAQSVARWDPSTHTWQALGSGTEINGGPAYTLATIDNRLYVGGDYFYGIVGTGARNIGCWDLDAQTWSGIGRGMDKPVRAAAVLNDHLYVGGDFFTAGDIVAHSIAEYEPATNSWTPLGSGVVSYLYSTYVSALTVMDGRLYVGGRFHEAGGISSYMIAAWDPTSRTWSTLQGGVNSYVYDLAPLDGRLYAGGLFYVAGTTNARYIACWDPTIQTWSALGSGTSSAVSAVAALNGKVYAGGNFTTAGGISAIDIAAWDPATQTWSALGSGTNGEIKALAVLDGQLYAGGSFGTVNGLSAANIARYDPAMQAWFPLGLGTNGTVSALGVWNGKLCVGGNFGTAGGVNATRIALWDPAAQTWSAFGQGIDGSYVYAVTPLGDDLFVGGDFSKAAGEVSAFLARWSPAGPPISVPPVSQDVSVGASVSLTVSASTIGTPAFQWRKDLTLLADGPRISGATTATLTIEPAALADGGSYDAVVTDDCGSTAAPPAILTVTCPSHALADLDSDCDVDDDDLRWFADCAFGPRIDLGAGCESADLDGDGDADSGDFAAFQRCISGAFRPPRADCN